MSWRLAPNKPNKPKQPNKYDKLEQPVTMSNKPFYISVLLLLMTITSVFLISRRGEPVVVKTNIENLPMEIAGFKATEDFFPDSVNKELNADMSIYRHYRSEDGERIDLYIGYYGTAKGGRTGHNPYGCLPGAGWGIIESYRVRLKSTYYPKGVEVNCVLSRKGPVCDVLLYWYQSDRYKVLSTGIQQNMQRFVGRILYNRNDGAFIRVSATTDAQHIAESKKTVAFFAQKILEIIPDYWPEER